jgi:hypothetical protein
MMHFNVDSCLFLLFEEARSCQSEDEETIIRGIRYREQYSEMIDNATQLNLLTNREVEELLSRTYLLFMGKLRMTMEE